MDCCSAAPWTSIARSGNFTSSGLTQSSRSLKAWARPHANALADIRHSPTWCSRHSIAALRTINARAAIALSVRP